METILLGFLFLTAAPSTAADSGSVETYLLMAEYYRGSGFPDSAQRVLEEGYQKTQNPDLLKALLQISYDLGSYRAVTRRAQEFLRRFGPDSLVYDLLVRSWMGLEAEKPARTWAQRYLDLYPDYPPAIHLAANVFDVLDQPDRALRLYRRLFILAPDTLRFVRDYIALLVREDLLDEAEWVLKRVYPKFQGDYKIELSYGALLEKKGDYASAMYHYSMAHQMRPSLEILRRMARLALNLGKYEDALSILTASKQGYPLAPSLRKLRGIALYSLRRDAEALDELLGALALDTTDPEIPYYLARVLYRLGQEVSATQYARRAYRKSHDPDYGLYVVFLYLMRNQPEPALQLLDSLNLQDRAHFHTLKGFAFELLGDTARAYQELRQAVALDPENPKRKRDLISLCLRMGRQEEAQQLLEDLRRRGQASREDLMNLALLYADQKAYLRADSLYRALYQADSTDPLLLNNWGYLLAEAGMQLEFAKQLVQKALELDPDNPIYLDSMGWVYYKLGDLKTAEYYIARAIDLGAKDPEILEHMGDLQAAKGNLQRALEYWQQAFKQNPKNDELRQKIQQAQSPDRDHGERGRR